MPLAALGLRGSGSYSAAERPQSWREMILALFPNGKAPLTALLSKLRSEPVDDPIFNWFEKDVPVQSVLYYSPTNPFNYTQIFRTPLYLTRTALKTRLRTGNAYQEAKREALELHAIEMEKAFIFGEQFTGTGTNGQPLKQTGGIISFLGADATFTNVWDFSSTTFNTANWENTLENVFRYGS